MFSFINHQLNRPDNDSFSFESQKRKALTDSLFGINVSSRHKAQKISKSINSEKCKFSINDSLAWTVLSIWKDMRSE